MPIATPLSTVALRSLAARRAKLAAVLTVAMVATYFGFIALVAFAPARLGTLITDGLSLGVLLGALVIATAWLLTWIYVRWTNRVYDPGITQVRTDTASEARVTTERGQ